MNKDFIINLVMIIISITLLLIIIEIFLHYENYYHPYKRFEYKINNINYNFNDDPKKYLNDNNDEKIIFLGDSFTEAAACASKKKDFVNLIKLQWGINHKSSIYNFASGAKGPADYLNIYNYFKQKNLRRVIVVLYYNDMDINFNDCLVFKELSKNGYPIIKKCDDFKEKKITYQNDTLLKKIDNIFEFFNTWSFIKNRLANFPFLQKYYARVSLVDAYNDQQSENFIVFLNVLKHLQTDAKENEIIIDFLYYPDVYDLKEGGINNKVWKFFIDVAKTKNIIINNPLEYFMENKDSDNMSWSSIDFHPSCEAHRIMANYITEKII